MALGWIGAVGLVALALPSPADSPVAWSPDGEWIAYTVNVQDPGHALPKRWLFQTDSLKDDGADDGPAPSEPAPEAAFRLWVTRVNTGQSVLLERSRGVLSAPCWSRDGRALAFARAVPDGERGGRYEVVVQDDADHQRVILTRRLDNPAAALDALSTQAPAWSPDGRFLAVPLPQQTLDLAVIRADNGRILKIFPDCERPAWSPDTKNAILAFVHGSEPQMLQWVDGSFGAPRFLFNLGRTTQSPVWLDAGTLAAVAALGVRHGAEPMPEQFLLIRIALETSAAPQKILELSVHPAEPRGSLRGGSFSFDSDRENLFFTRATWGPPYEIVWSRPRRNEILKSFYPYDYTLVGSALAVAPSDRLLAFRTGGGGSEALPSVVDLTEDRLVAAPLVPDDDVRVQWVAMLIQTARRLLFVGLPPAKPRGGDEVERPSILPLPGELSPQHDILGRLRKLGRTGRPICDRPADASPAEPAVEALLAEARLFFDYLRQDYDAALASLDELEKQLTSPDERLRLLSIRAQLYVGQGRGEQARETIDYLRGRERGPVERIEDTPLGPEFRSVVGPGRGWPTYLAERSEAYLKAVRKPGGGDGNPQDPFGNRNVDAPDGGLFEAPAGFQRPGGFPFVAPRRELLRVGPQPMDNGPDLVLPPGGVAPPPFPPPRAGFRRARQR